MQGPFWIHLHFHVKWPSSDLLPARSEGSPNSVLASGYVSLAIGPRKGLFQRIQASCNLSEYLIQNFDL